MKNTEFYDALDRFIEDLIVSMPASYEEAVEALELKAGSLRQKYKIKRKR